MSRKLAHIEKIEKISPILGADSIEVADVLGWKCVVKKGEFRVGQKIVYIEIDSILPKKPEFEFMSSRNYRVKTIKLRGQISQGMVFPISIIPGNYTERDFNVGDDVTDKLEIEKYDIQDSATKNVSKRVARFPEWIKKTDEERVQNMPWVFDKYRNKKFVFTEKLDGQSATYFLNKKRYLFGLVVRNEFGVCSRNLQIFSEDKSSYWTVYNTHSIDEVLINLSKHYNSNRVVLQGEIIGTGIQGNKYKIDGFLFYVYNLIVDDKKINDLEMRNVLYNQLPCVPLLENGEYLPNTVDEIVSMADSKSVLSNTPREGIVVRNYEHDISFKVINPTFLLKYGE